MIAQISSFQMTPEEYLAFEEKSSKKHEYIDGKVYAMSGTTDTHNRISINAVVALETHLRAQADGSDCEVYMADVKAQLVNRKNYYYPDVMVTCAPEDRANNLSKRYPKLIIEVLSDSTEGFDRGDKFVDYQTFDSLEEYVLISTRHRRVDIFRRAEGGLWVLQIYQSVDEKPDEVLDERARQKAEVSTETVVEFKSMGLSVPLSDLYRGVRLQPERVSLSVEAANEEIQ